MSLVCRDSAVSLLAILLTLSVSVVKANQNQAATLFKEGYTLYEQHFASKALVKFKEAAALRHSEAAYYAGDLIRQDYTYITEESEQYYRQAAEGGDVYAMLRLSRIDSVCGTLRACDYDQEAWIDKALDTALSRAEKGDSEAMMQLFSVYWQKGQRSKAFEWTKRAAEHGNPFAQYWLAVGLLDEREMGFYWTQSGRREDILKWLKASAEQGFPKAMHRLAIEYAEDNRMEEAVEWVNRMGTTDYFSALFEYGLVLVAGPDGSEGKIQYPEAKPIEGLAVLLALHRETGNATVHFGIEQILTDLDPEQVEQARTRSKELLVDTPIMHYLPKYGI